MVYNQKTNSQQYVKPSHFRQIQQIVRIWFFLPPEHHLHLIQNLYNCYLIFQSVEHFQSQLKRPVWYMDRPPVGGEFIIKLEKVAQFSLQGGLLGRIPKILLLHRNVLSVEDCACWITFANGYGELHLCFVREAAENVADHSSTLANTQSLLHGHFINSMPSKATCL